MEEERKKKKNKKKKNKQTNKTTEPVTIHAEGSASDNQSHSTEKAHARNDQVSEISVSPNDIVEDSITVCSKRADGQCPLLSHGTDPEMYWDPCHVREMGIAHQLASNVPSITDKHELRSNGIDEKKSAEADRQYWLDREASFEEKIKELQAAKDAQIQKESNLEEKISQLLEEKEELANIQAAEMVVQQKEVKQLNDYNSTLVQNEAVLKEKVIQLEKEKDELIQKEVLSEQTIQRLENEKATQLQKEANLEINILQLEGERNTWLQKEASLQEKIDGLKQDMDSWTLKEAEMEKKIILFESERDSWIQTQASLQETISGMKIERDSLIYEVNSAKESIARMEDDSTNLRAKVLELEHSRNALLEETRRLSENISNLQIEIKNLEKTSYSNSNSITAAKLVTEDGNSHGPIEKLVAENSQLVEKVNESYAEPEDQSNVRTDAVSGSGSSIARSLDITGDIVLTTDSPLQANQNHETQSSAYSTFEATSERLLQVSAPEIIASSSEIVEVDDDIMQVPLEEETYTRENTEATQNDRESDVPITDAPLIGAPFRFMSFIARYVSGEDLVSKNTGNL